MECKFCSRPCKSKNSLIQHELRCKKNPDRIISSIPKNANNPGFRSYLAKVKSGEIPAWNKGLTKYTDSRVKYQQERVSEAVKKCKQENRKWSKGIASTPELELLRRKKIAEGIHKSANCGGLRHGSGRGHKGWYKNYFCDSVYELVYVIYDNSINYIY